MVIVRGQQKENQVLRLSYYGFLIVVLIFFSCLTYIGSDIISNFINYYELLYFSVIPFLLGIITITCAVLSLVVTTFGCIGIQKLTNETILLFAITLAISFLGNFALSITSFSIMNTLKSAYEQSMPGTIALYDEGNFNSVQRTWDYLQNKYNCCGAHDYSDWNIIYQKPKLPYSCCYIYTKCNIYSEYLREQGCLEPLVTELESIILTIAVVTIAFAVVQMFGIAIAVYAMKVIRRSKFSDYYSNAN